MSTYRPDCWVVIKITTPEETFYKILAGWFGGYLGSNSWRINSGVSDYKIREDWIEFYGESGSAYNCHRSLEETNFMTGSILRQMEEQNGDGFTTERITLEQFLQEFKKV